MMANESRMVSLRYPFPDMDKIEDDGSSEDIVVASKPMF